MTFSEFEERADTHARQLEDRLLRYVSSPQDHDLAMATYWPLIWLRLGLTPHVRTLPLE